MLHSRNVETSQEELNSSRIPGSLDKAQYYMLGRAETNQTHAGLQILHKRSEKFTCYTLAVEGCQNHKRRAGATDLKEEIGPYQVYF